jgi:hypothetical protein
MKIFVSYSFRDETRWVDDYVLPLIRCFGHVPETGRILDGNAIPDEVRQRIKGCKRVLCFVTRAGEICTPDGSQTGYYNPPDWVRDELMLSRGAEKVAIEFREKGVTYGGAAPFSAWHPFDRTELPALLLRLAEILKEWPVGPLQLRLSVPAVLAADFDTGVNKGTLRAKCIARYSEDDEVSADLPVRKLDNQYVISFWIKPDPNLAIEIEIDFGSGKLVCRGILPATCIATLSNL